MALYLVRAIEDHQIVGLVSASNPARLADVVDEYMDPSGCEFCRLRGDMGVLWPERAPTLPFDFNEDDEPLGKDAGVDVFNGAEMSWSLLGAVTDDDHEWSPLAERVS